MTLKQIEVEKKQKYRYQSMELKAFDAYALSGSRLYARGRANEWESNITPECMQWTQK